MSECACTHFKHLNNARGGGGWGVTQRQIFLYVIFILSLTLVVFLLHFYAYNIDMYDCEQ